MKVFVYVLCWLFVGSGVVLAQGSEKQLAVKYFQDQEFAKAEELFEGLYKESGDKNDFGYLLKCYTALNQYDKADKLVKNAIKNYPTDVTYPVEQICLFKLEGKPDKADKKFEELLDGMKPKAYLVSNMANVLISKNEYDYALQVFAKGIKLLGDEDLFRFDKARLFAMQRNYDAMLFEYLEMLKLSPNYYSSVQNNLQYYLTYDVEENLSNTVKKQLLKYTNDYPNNSAFTDLLIWLYLQEKKFDLAFVHVRALDMRYLSTGDKLIEFGLLAMQNEAFGAAEKAFNAVLEFGDKAKPMNVQNAQMGLLEATYERVCAEPQPVRAEMEGLLARMLAFVNEPRQGLSFPLVEKLTDLQAFRLNEPDSAIANVQRILNGSKMVPADKVKIEMLLADLYLASGDPWEAVLAYARIETANKHNEIGHEAKFRKTKVAYFTGDFQWAKTQLDILKASTSKLIANDAFALSLLLKDNMEEDSISPALQQFADAQMCILQKRNDSAFTTLDSLITEHKTETIAEYALFEKAKLQTTTKQYEAAAASYQLLIDTYAFSLWADDALFYRALLLKNQLGKPTESMDTFKKLLLDHKGSVFVIEARKHFRYLRGDKPTSKDEEDFYQSLNK